MDVFVTVATFMWPTDAVVPRGLLEGEGIEVRMKDEMTVQVHNFYSQAVGGVKLQVPEADAERARELLREGGFLHDTETEQGEFWPEIDRVTRSIPLIGRVDLLMARVMVLVTLILLVVLVPIVISAQPDTVELLTKTNWCVERVQVDGKDVVPYSTSSGLVIVMMGCAEPLNFDRRGSVRLPGYESPSQEVTWLIDNGGLHFEGITAHHDVYGGAFALTVNDHYLTLRSAHTVIYCTRSSIWL